MAEAAGLSPAEVEQLNGKLKVHMREYIKATKEQDDFRGRKAGGMPPAQVEKKEEALEKRARDLHHRFYQIKMMALSKLKNTKMDVYTELTELVNAGDFTDEERAALKREIAQHKKSMEAFTKLHTARTREGL